MGRRLRMNLPGVPFHVTARLQHREPLFTDVERRVFRIIRHSVKLYRVRLLAYAVMPNHLHLVLIQGEEPLARVMQAIGRRTALLVHRITGRAGHVFERAYYAAPCMDADYLRNAIAYVHLNPVRARICETPGAYKWSSHRDYMECDDGDVHPPWRAAESGLRLFAEQRAASVPDCRTGYEAFLRYRRHLDILKEQDPHQLRSDDRVPPPLLPGGDHHWLEEFARAAAEAAGILRAVPMPRPDLRTIALQSIDDPDPMEVLELLRLGYRSHGQLELRRTIIARSLRVGYRTSEIARFLHVSEHSVSRVAAYLRRCPILT